MKLTATALAAALWLTAGCASAPPAPRASAPAAEISAAKIPEHWTAVSAGDVKPSPSGDAWWRSFGSTVLDELVDETLARNLDLRAAAAAVEEAVALARVAGAERAPRAEVGGDAASRQQIFVGLPIPGLEGPLKANSDVFSLTAGVSWEADLWGRLRAGHKAAGADAAAAREDYAAARLSIAAQTARAYFLVVELQRQLDLAESTAGSRSTTAARLLERYRNGVGASLDVRLARADEARAQSTVELRRRQLDAARRQLEVLLGRYPAGELGGESEDAAPLPAMEPFQPAALPADLVTRRPDLRAAERRLEAAGWRVAEARRALFPRLSFSADFGTTSNRVADLLDGDFSIWTLAGNLLQPLFQGGRLRAAVDFAEASRERVLAGYVEAVLRAFAEVETALAAERSLAAEEEALRTAAGEAAAALGLAEERFQAGVGDVLAVLESRRRLFDAESRLLAVRGQRLATRINLYTALGGETR